MRYLTANFKSNLNRKEVLDWIDGLVKKKKGIEGVEVVVCPAFVHWELFRGKIGRIKLGGQTLSPFPDGTYTGAVSARMAASWIKYVILGHSERRKWFGEKETTVANQARLAIENEITPIIGVDEENWQRQLGQFSEKELKQCLVMFEPPEAISDSRGQGKAADKKMVAEMARKIKEEFGVKGVMYGGSVKKENAAEFWQIKEIDGLVVGSASLKVEEWKAIMEIVGKTKAD